MQPLRPCWGQKCWAEQLQHEPLELINGAHPVQPFLNSMGSCSAQFPGELSTSKPSPRALHPSTQQNVPVQSPTAEVRFPPLRDTGRGIFTAWCGRSLLQPQLTLLPPWDSCKPLTRARILPPWPLDPSLPNNKKAQQHKNSLTQKEKGPRFLLVPPTDRLHSLQTYNNTKTNPMLPNFGKMNGRSGTGSPTTSPAMPGEAAVGHSPPTEALNQWSTHPSSMCSALWMRLNFTQLLPSLSAIPNTEAATSSLMAT